MSINSQGESSSLKSVYYTGWCY